MLRFEGAEFTREELAILEKMARGEMTTEQVRAYGRAGLKFH